jgi:hypothetical protein
LRSFADDRNPTAAEIPTVGQFAVALPNPTEEEDIAHALGAIGPVLAIGNPSEKLPTLGAARLYVTSERWQDVVLKLVTSAKLVVLRSAATRGLAWEVEKVVRHVAPERILLYITGDYARFRELVKSVLPHELPADIGISRFIAFDADWEPKVLKRRNGGFDLQISGEAATVRKELAYVLATAGSKAPSLGRKLLRAFLLIVGLILFFVAVVWFGVVVQR